MTQYPEIWNALAADFPDRVVRERVVGGNRKASYITARTAMNRLDDVLGWENWEDAYESDANGSDNVLCKITVTLPDGRKITKADSGAPSKMGDDGEDEKGAFSDAFKRAAVKFGVGRYLYGEGVYKATVSSQGRPEVEPAPRAEPMKPRIADTDHQPPSQARAPYDSQTRGARDAGKEPISGSQLYAWARDQGKLHGVDLVGYLETWGGRQRFPKLLKDWDVDQVEKAHKQARHKLASKLGNRGDAREEALSN